MPKRSPSSRICMTSVSPIWIFNKFQQPRLTCEAKTSLKRRRTRPAFVKPRVESMGLRGGCQAWVRFCGLYYHPLNTWTLEHFGQNSSVFASRGGGRWYNMVFSRWDNLMQLQMSWESPLTKTCSFHWVVGKYHNQSFNETPQVNFSFLAVHTRVWQLTESLTFCF